MPFEALEKQPLWKPNGSEVKEGPATGFEPLEKQPGGAEQATMRILVADRGEVAEIPRSATRDQVEDALAGFYAEDPSEVPGLFPEHEEQWKGQGSIGVHELAKRRDLLELSQLVPVYGTVEDAIDSVSLLATVNRLKANTYGADADTKQKDVQRVVQFLLLSEEERVRGYTIGGRIMSGASHVPAFIGEFLLTGGLASIGKEAFKRSVAQIAKGIIKSSADDITKAFVKSQVARGATKVGAAMAGSATRFPAFTQYAVNKYAQDRVQGSIEMTEKGEVLLKDMEEKPYTTFMRAAADTYIEILSEVAGPGIKAVGAKALRPIGGMIPKKIATRLAPIMRRMNPGKKAENLFTRAGVSGFLEEYGEERLGGFLRATFNVNDFGTGEGANVFDRIVASWPQGEDALVEIGVLAFPQGARLGVSEGFNFVARRKEAKAAEVEKKAAEKAKIEEKPPIPPTEAPVPPTAPEAPAVAEPTPPVVEEPEAKVLREREEEIEKEAPETEAEAEARIAQEDLIEDEYLTEEIKRIGKFRKTKDIQEEQRAIPRIFITTDPNAKTMDEVATDLKMTQNELLERVKQIGEQLKGRKARVSAAKQTVKQFEKVERLRQKRAAIREKAKQKKADIEQIKRDLIEYITKNLRLEERGRKELFQKVKNVKNQEQLTKALDRVDELAELQAQRFLIGRIKKELDTAKIRKVSGRPVGKFTAKTQQLLDLSRQAFKMTPEQAAEAIQKNVEQYADQIPPSEIALQNKVLSTMARARTMTSVELAKVLSVIRSFKEGGRKARQEQLLREEADLDAKREIARHVIESAIPAERIPTSRGENADDKLFGWWNRMTAHFLGWDNLMNRLSSGDRTTTTNQSDLSKIAKVSPTETAEKKGVRLQTEKFLKMFDAAFGTKTSNQRRKKWAKDAKRKELGTFKNEKGQKIKLELSVAEARKRVMEFRDPTLIDTFTDVRGMAYTSEMMKAIEGMLSKQDQAFVDAQMDFYRDYYVEFNIPYSEAYGVNLPQNRYYSPIARKSAKKEALVGEFMDEIQLRRSIVPGAAKLRVRTLAEIRQQNDVDVFIKHITQVEHFKAWRKTIRMLNSIFGDAEIRDAIRETRGAVTLRIIDRYIGRFTRGNRNLEETWLDHVINTIKNNYTISVLAIKEAIQIKQLVSFPAYADAIPVVDFVEGLLDFAKTPSSAIEKTKLLAQSEVMQARGLGFTPELQEALRDKSFSLFKRSPTWASRALILTRIGDRGAIYFGGWSIYRYHRKLGKSHEEAMRMFEDVTSETQQSADLSQLSEFQSGNSFQRLFAVFLSAPNQYFRKELTAYEDLIAGRMPVKQFAKRIMIYHFILPMLFQFIVDGLKWKEDEQKRAAILGSLNGFFVIGQLLDGLIRAALRMKPWRVGTVLDSLIEDSIRMMSKLTADDLTDQDFWEAVEDGVSLAGKGTGVPAQQVMNMKKGFDLIADGEVEKGVKLIAGWSEYILDGPENRKGGRRFRK